MELLVFNPKKLAWFLAVLQRGLLNAAAQAWVCVKLVTGDPSEQSLPSTPSNRLGTKVVGTEWERLSR